MKEYRAQRYAARSGFVGLSYRGKTIVEAHSWRRGQDRGKRRLTHGIYGTKSKIMQELKKSKQLTTNLRWNKFRNGKFMVW